jgi:hypothetical protein
MLDSSATPPPGPASDARLIGKIARVVLNDFTYLHPRYRLWIITTLIMKLREQSPGDIDVIHDFIHSLDNAAQDNEYDGLKGLL